MKSLALLLLSGVACAATACSDAEETDATAGMGSVGESWKGACVATFSEEYEVDDGFGDPLFTVKKGATYLIGSIGFAGGVEPELIEVTADGPVTFEVEAKDGTWESLPFTSNCDPDTAVPYRGVFADVTVYADKALSNKLCELENGDQVLADDDGFGYALESSFNVGEESVYEVTLGALSQLCGDSKTGFISVPSSQIAGAYTSLVPLQTFLMPE